MEEQWIEERPQRERRSAKHRAADAASAAPEPFRLSPEAVAEVEERAGRRSERLVRYLREASKAYAAERWSDAKKSLRPLLEAMPDAPSVRELNGMVLYRTGKWAAALEELQYAHLQTQSFDLYPVMMDCLRALRRYDEVEPLWEELRLASPAAEVMAEGRIVMASALSDSGRVADGIRLLEKAPRPRSQPKLYHLRMWYVLGDLYDRGGDLGKARTTFERVALHDPELADVLDRIDALR